MMQLNLFSSEDFDAITIPETMIECWREHHSKEMTLNQYVESFVAEIKLWAARNPQKDYSEILSAEQYRYIKTIYR